MPGGGVKRPTELPGTDHTGVGQTSQTIVKDVATLITLAIVATVLKVNLWTERTRLEQASVRDFVLHKFIYNWESSVNG